MGIELLEIGVKMRKAVIFTIRGCYRSVCTHPFLVGMLCFLILMYRSSPFIFSLFVSASPVLVCTAVLLGTLLSFGQPNIPEIEIEEITTHEAVSLKKNGVSNDATVVENNESYYVERFSDKRRDETEQPNLSAGDEVRGEHSSDDTAPLIEERLREVNFGDLRYKQKTEEEVSDVEVVEHKYVPVPNVDDEHLELDDDKTENWEVNLKTDEKFNDYTLVPNVDDDEHHELDDEKAETENWEVNLGDLRDKQKTEEKLDDEHLELDDEKSETNSFDSERVNVDSLDSPPRSPWKRIEEHEDDKNEKDEEEEDDEDLDSESDRAESSSPDASMADIMPMLDELHPLLDENTPQPVPTSPDHDSEHSHESDDDESETHEDDLEEVADDDEEKDERTKSVIAWTEEDQKNLMDLGSSEIERNIRLENLIMRRRARKNVTERNLIDLESSDLPFSIPSISTRRQNPFDTPHDSYDDDSGLPPIPGSAPSVLLPRRNPFDIPYDSSEEKPNLVGDGFQEPLFRRHESFSVRSSFLAPNRRGDVRMRPYFVPEGTVSEESSYSPFRRQTSELSDYSKVSSVPETESIGSVEDLEERKLKEEDDFQEVEAETPKMKEETEEGAPSLDLEVISQEETEEDVPREREVTSAIERVSEHVGHGSESSEGEEEEDSLELGRQVEQVSGFVSNSEGVEQRYSRDSSSSSLSVSERVFTMTDGEEDLPMLEEGRDVAAEEEPRISRTSSAVVDEIQHREPVYDLSPRDSVPSRTVSFTERESEGSNREIESSVLDESELRPIDVTKEHDDANTLESSSEALVEENQVSSSSDVENIHTLVGLSEDEKLDQSQEESLLVISERGSLIQAGEPPFESPLTAEHSNDIKETVQSPNEVDERLIPTPDEGNSSFSYDEAIHEPTFTHLGEVQASNTLLESSEEVGIKELNMQEIQDLDYDISSNIYSPLNPDFIPIPSIDSVTTSTHVDDSTIVEEVDEINDIDAGLLSELDSIGDFSMSSGNHAETSTITAIEVNSVEVNKIENPMHSEISREDVDMKEEGSGFISELQTSETRSIDEHIDVSNKEYFSERDGQDSPDQITSAIPELEASTLKEIDLQFMQISDEEIEKPVCLEPPQAELETQETVTVERNSSVTGSIHEASILEFRSMEDDIMDHKQLDSVVHVLHLVEHGETQGTSSESHNEEPVSEESTNLPLEKVVDGNIEEQVKPNSDDESVEIKKDEEICYVAGEKMEHEAEEAQGSSTGLNVDEPVSKEITILPLEEQLKPASEDVSVAIKKDKEISVDEAEKTEQNLEAQESTNLSLEKVGDGNTEIEMNPDSDDASVEIKKDEEISAVSVEKTEQNVQAQGRSLELHVEEPVSDESTNLPSDEVRDGNTEKQVKPDFDDTWVEIKKDEEISAVSAEKTDQNVEAQQSSTELHVVEPVSSESTNLPPEEVIDGKTEKQVQPIEIKKDEEISQVAAEKPSQKVEEPEDLHPTPSVKGKGKLSKSSSSSSSSSSESSSSDSDQE